MQRFQSNYFLKSQYYLINTIQCAIPLNILTLPTSVDDATNSVSVQLGGGYFGVIAVAIFGSDGVILSPSKSSAYVK